MLIYACSAARLSSPRFQSRRFADASPEVHHFERNVHSRINTTDVLATTHAELVAAAQPDRALERANGAKLVGEEAKGPGELITWRAQVQAAAPRTSARASARASASASAGASASASMSARAGARASASASVASAPGPAPAPAPAQAHAQAHPQAPAPEPAKIPHALK